MKRKKLFASAVAGMLVAAQMVMPVMAVDSTPAPDGSVTVDVQTISPVIRVAVPTSLQISVNEFEKDDAGSQIFSTPFTMTNKSEVPVKVKVTSEQAQVDSNNLADLVQTKKAAEEEATTHKAWLAVAAQVAKDKYIADAGKALRDLTETNANVVTFGTDKKATQSFYLATPGTAVTYTAFVIAQEGNGGADLTAAKKKAKAEISYAKFYKMTALSLAGGSELADLKAAVAKEDIYKIGTVDSTTKRATVQRIEQGTPESSITYENTGIKGYYKMGAVTEIGDFTNTAETVYVYGETTGNTSVAGDSAAFRYIGKLAQNGAAWAATEVGQIKITYDVDGISQDRYNSVKNFCEYGFFKSLVGKTTAGTSVMNNAATPATIATKAAIAGRLKNTTNNTIQFVLTANQLATVKAEGLKVLKISYMTTAAAAEANATPTPIEIGNDNIVANANPAANTDGKLYQLTADDFKNVASIDYIIVEYGKSGVSSMKVKYAFAAQ